MDIQLKQNKHNYYVQIDMSAMVPSAEMLDHVTFMNVCVTSCSAPQF